MTRRSNNRGRSASQARGNSGSSQAVALFRLLPSEGFWWPVYEEGSHGRVGYRPPLDVRTSQAVMRGISGALRLGSDRSERGYLLGDEDGDWEDRHWPWGVTEEVLERALVGLVLAATDVLEDMWVDIFEEEGRFAREIKDWDGGAWYARSEVSWWVILKVLRLVMVAREGWLERVGSWNGPPDSGSLANAVDGLLNVIECEFAEDYDVTEWHWENAEGWEFVEGWRLEGAWVG